MKKTKLSIVIIIVIILVVAALGLLAVSFYLDSNQDKSTKKNSGKELIAPVLELNLNTLEEEQEKVIIKVKAKTEDEAGIKYIELPDGTQIFSDNKDYEVTENGKYEFKAFGENGSESKLSIEVKNIRETSAKSPYVPEGFEHVEGEVDDGFVIQDKYNNQYVWIPVESGILTRTTVSDSEYEETSEYATGLINSVAKNYGFYISRFEASAYQGNGVKFAASLENQVPWTNVSYKEAEEAAINTASVLQYPEDIVTAVTSSHAWDTTLSWIDQSVQSYSSNISYGNYSGTILSTGATESDKIKNICDLAGNVREWTTEIYNDPNEEEAKSTSTKKGEEVFQSRVIRGGSAYINKIASSRNGYPENLVDEYWGFRLMLYKNN